MIGDGRNGGTVAGRVLFSAVAAASFVTVLMVIGFKDASGSHEERGPVTMTAYAPEVAPAAPDHIADPPASSSADSD